MARRGGPRSRILRATLGRRRQPAARACCDRRGGAPRAFPGGPIEALGKRFDPTLHEAVAMKERAEAPGTVVGVVEDGYTINGRLLRPARVVQKPGRTPRRPRGRGEALAGRREPASLEGVEAAFDHYAEAIASVGSEGLTQGLPVDALERIFTLGFALDQMRQDLRDLDRCVSEIAGRR